MSDDLYRAPVTWHASDPRLWPSQEQAIEDCYRLIAERDEAHCKLNEALCRVTDLTIERDTLRALLRRAMPFLASVRIGDQALDVLVADIAEALEGRDG